MDFSPKCYLFRECNSDRIGQDIQNEVSLERSVFEEVVVYQLYPASRGPSIFLDKSGRLNERCVTRQNRNNTWPRTNRVSKCENLVLSFKKPAFFIFDRHMKGFRETIYFSRNI